MDWLKKLVYGESEQVELCNELEQSKVQIHEKWALKHRLITDPDYDPAHNGWYNRQLKERRALADQLKGQKRWPEFVTCHTEESYPSVLEEIKDVAAQADWCEAVRSAWYGSTVLMNNRQAWTRIFSEYVRLDGVASKKDAARLAKEPDPLTVYRGCLPENRDGMSWSISFDAAEHFRRRAGHKGVTFKGVVKKEHLLAYLNPNREEFEIVVLPEHVTEKEVVE